VLFVVSGISQAASALEQLKKPVCYDDFLSIRKSKEADRQSHFVPKKRKSSKETVTVSHSILHLPLFFFHRFSCLLLYISVHCVIK